MPKRKKRTWPEHQALLEYLVDHSLKEAAQHFSVTEAAVRTWLYKLRHNLRQEQAAINQIRTLQRISPRVRKLTTCGGVPDQEEEEEIIV